MVFGNCRNPDRAVERLATMPDHCVIKNSNTPDLMGLRGISRIFHSLARFPLNDSRTVI
jgi:hypothetical protein